MAVPNAPPASRHGVKNPQDLVSGIFFLLIGIAGLWIAQDYPVGTPQRMGTGAFPRMLCWGLILIGAVIAVQALIAVGERLTEWSLRPFFWVLLSILAFSFLLESAGFAIANMALLLLAAAGSPETRWKEAVVFSIGMTVMGWALFIWGLGLPLRVWPI